MEKLLKELSGHSGSRVYLMQDREQLFVRKIGNVERNYERLTALKDILPVPEVYSYDGRILDMEYVHGLDMINYLENHSTEHLVRFLLTTLDTLSSDIIDKDYTSTYNEVLYWMNDDDELPFTKSELIDRLPKRLPRSLYYHGDMTLENIVYDIRKKKFVFIDPVTVKYDSYLFDIAKLRQDVECHWFLRKSKSRLSAKVFSIQESILKKYSNAADDHMLILMLLRVYLHCKKNSSEYRFIVKEISRLWK